MIRTLAAAMVLVPSVAASQLASGGQPLPAGHPAIFNDAFTHGHSTTIDGRAVRFDTRRLGMFRVPSGQLVACDPFVCEDDFGLPFVKPVPRGEFPLSLAVADFGDQQRIALAKIAFSAEPVVRWELALVEGQDAASLGPGEIFAYGVDLGTGAFMDAEAWRAFTARIHDNDDVAEQLLQDLEATGWPQSLLISSGPGSVALFSSGWGDGHYATYWGYDAAGNLAAVLTDFYVVAWNLR